MIAGLYCIKSLLQRHSTSSATGGQLVHSSRYLGTSLVAPRFAWKTARSTEGICGSRAHCGSHESGGSLTPFRSESHSSCHTGCHGLRSLLTLPFRSDRENCGEGNNPPTSTRRGEYILFLSSQLGNENSTRYVQLSSHHRYTVLSHSCTPPEAGHFEEERCSSTFVLVIVPIPSSKCAPFARGRSMLTRTPLGSRVYNKA